jgi:hypothetical protein
LLRCGTPRYREDAQCRRDCEANLHAPAVYPSSELALKVRENETRYDFTFRASSRWREVPGSECW